MTRHVLIKAANVNPEGLRRLAKHLGIPGADTEAPRTLAIELLKHLDPPVRCPEQWEIER